MNRLYRLLFCVEEILMEPLRLKTNFSEHERQRRIRDVLEKVSLVPPGIFLSRKPNCLFSIIRTLRMKWGLTAEELAGRANLTWATVAKIEGGDGNPTIETINSLSSVFQLTSSELIRLAEAAQCEVATTKAFKTDHFDGFHR